MTDEGKGVFYMEESMRKRAQSLRTNATKEENKLWYQYLRKYPIQWNRQKQIGGYIADFYCFKAKLVIELDGSQHYEKNAIEYDTARTDILEGLGLKVLRFTNKEVNENFRGVCETIDAEVLLRLR